MEIREDQAGEPLRLPEHSGSDPVPAGSQRILRHVRAALDRFPGDLTVALILHFVTPVKCQRNPTRR